MHDVLAFVADDAAVAVVVVVIVCPETSQPPTGGSGPGLPPTSSSSFSSSSSSFFLLHNSVARIHLSVFVASAASFGCSRNFARMLRVSLTGFTALAQGEVNTTLCSCTGRRRFCSRLLDTILNALTLSPETADPLQSERIIPLISSVIVTIRYPTNFNYLNLF